MSWLVTAAMACAGLSLLIIVVFTLAVLISAVLGRTTWLRPRQQTPEERARHEQVQRWYDQRAKAAGIGIASISLGLPIGLLVAALTKRRANPNEGKPILPPAPNGGNQAARTD